MIKTLNRMLASRVGIAAIAAIATTVVLGGVSYASIPDGAGVIHGCYKAQGVAYPLNVLNNSVHASCPAGYKALKWYASPPGVGVGTGAATAGTSGGATCTLGEVSLFAQHGPYLPTHYLIANGQLQSISGDVELYDLIGTTYGGDGNTTFALPNLQALAPNHMTYAICDNGNFP